MAPSSHDLLATRRLALLDPVPAPARSMLIAASMSSSSSNSARTPSSGPPRDSFARTRQHSGDLLKSPSKLAKRYNRKSRFLGGRSEYEEVAGTADDAGQHEKSSIKESVQEQQPWYEEHHPPGGFAVQRYARDQSWFLSYSPAVQDRDAIRTSSLFGAIKQGAAAYLPAPNGEAPPPPPRRVLDLGAGPTPFWVLHMATQVWKETEFTALDVAPSSIVPELLAPEVAARIATVQHDMHEPLPFEDGEFDYVRLAFANLSLSEELWASLIEEAIRVLRLGYFVEIVESDTSVWRRKKPSRARSSSASSTEPFSAIDDMFADILADRFINPSPLSVVPSDLAMNATQLRSSGRISIPIPAKRPPPDKLAFPAVPASEVQLRPFSVGTNSAARVFQGSEASILLASTAGMFSSTSFGVARAVVAARQRKRTLSRRSRTSSGPESLISTPSLPAASLKEVQDAEDVFLAWTDDLRERADIAGLLESQFGWMPKFDKQTHSTLEAQVPIYNATIKDLSQFKVVQESVFGETDPDIDTRLQQLEFGRREAQAELAAVRHRLFGAQEIEADEGELLGTSAVEVFVAKAP